MSREHNLSDNVVWIQNINAYWMKASVHKDPQVTLTSLSLIVVVVITPMSTELIPSCRRREMSRVAALSIQAKSKITTCNRV